MIAYSCTGYVIKGCLPISRTEDSSLLILGFCRRTPKRHRLWWGERWRTGKNRTHFEYSWSRESWVLFTLRYIYAAPKCCIVGGVLRFMWRRAVLCRNRRFFPKPEKSVSDRPPLNGHTQVRFSKGFNGQVNRKRLTDLYAQDSDAAHRARAL